MNSIITTGFMGSGSSAATDLLREYENVSCPNGDYEYVFLHCPNGLFDLEDKLLCNNNAIRSDEALRSFRSTMNDLYGNPHWWFANYRDKLSPRFMQHVDAFIESLPGAEYEGFWYEHEKVSTNQQFIARVRRKLGMAGQGNGHLYGDVMRYSLPKPEEFYACAQQFVANVVNDVCSGEALPIALLDQMFLPHNLNRLNRYFPNNNAQALVVARDPRDVFVLNKYYWKPQNWAIPMPLDVQVFCDYYRAMREAVPACEEGSVLLVNFEDLVFQYEESVREIEAFLRFDLGAHVRAKECFNPAVSQRNCAVYADKPEYADEAAYIAEQLPEYIYEMPIDVLEQKQRSGEVF